MNALKDAMQVIEIAQAGDIEVPPTMLADAVDNIVRITCASYTQKHHSYAQLRELRTWDWDVNNERILLSLVRSRITSGKLVCDGPKWRLLDIGAGHGRDVVRLARECDIDVVALECAQGFMTTLTGLLENGMLAPGAVIEADMRQMSTIPTASFQCVRNNATLHHLPVVPGGFGADAAVAEAHRVLADGGIFYILVKAGNGIGVIDTEEGLGGRFFQLFTRDLLTELLERHSFSIVHLEEAVEPRPSGEVPWLFCLAVAQ